MRVRRAPRPTLRPDIRQALAALVLVALGALTAVPLRAQPVIPPALDAYAARLTNADSGRAVGLVVGVVDATGTVVRGYGRRSTEAGSAVPDAHMRFEIGSVTKALVGLVIADAAARGDVALDAPLATLLPDTLALDPHVAALTLADLATHRSGLPRLPTNMGIPGRDLDLADPYARYDAARLYAFLESLRPGRGLDTTRAFAYSNVGAGLAGHALARHLGTTVDALVRTRLAAPLGLTDTYVGVGGDAAREAQGHAVQGAMGQGQIGQRAATPPWTFTDALAAAGGVRSTAADVLRLLDALRTPSPAFAPAVEMALAPRARTSPGRHIGLFWMADGAIRWHNGGTGGFASFVGFDTATGRGVVVLSNTALPVDALGAHLLDPSRPLPD